MEQQIEKLLSQLTLVEKISMIHGATLFRTAAVERLGIPELSMSDGPMGVRMEFADAEWRMLENTDDLITYLPCNSAIASSWSRETAEKAGRVLGAEARGRGKDVILAPGINIKRSPLCGRNFEYMSEDPYLTAELVAPLIQGIQSNDVAACVKHFAANSQEAGRVGVDTVVDERTLQEVYFPGFRAAVEKGGVFSLMGAYNRLNGEWCCSSKSLLNRVLRDDWGFDGMIVSDWGGVQDTVHAARSALDVEMGVRYDFDNYYFAKPLLEKVRSGEISEQVIDEKIRNVLRLMLRLKMIGPKAGERSAGAYDTPEHRQVALEAARESLILLKNENVLPLDPRRVKKVTVIGANAAFAHAGGGGSAELKALYEITPLLGIRKLLGGNCRITYAPGYVGAEGGKRDEISWQASSTTQAYVRAVEPENREQVNEAYRLQALEAAKDADAVIFVGGLNHEYDVEGLDRADMKLPYGQDKLIEALLQVRPDAVVVLYGGSPVEMPWLPEAKALLWSYYAGLEGGTAIAEAIFGRINPSGKLAETFLKDLDACPAKLGVNFGDPKRVVYDEGVMVGYRHYNTVNTEVNFPFGHGLSYTRFAYDELHVFGHKVSVKVTNLGDRAGAEVVQLYIAPRGQWDPVRPAHQLRGFEKVWLEPGETKSVCFDLTKADFSVYDADIHAFRALAGSYCVQVGASSRDIRLEQILNIGGFGKEGLCV